jgi:hypothetical protein
VRLTQARQFGIALVVLEQELQAGADFGEQKLTAVHRGFQSRGIDGAESHVNIGHRQHQLLQFVRNRLGEQASLDGCTQAWAWFLAIASRAASTAPARAALVVVRVSCDARGVFGPRC